MEIYRSLGITDVVRAAALPGGPKRHLGRDVVSPWRSIISSGVSAGAEADTTFGPETLEVVLCSQDALEPILVDAVSAEATVETIFGANATDISDTGDRVVMSITTETGTTTVAAKYVIAADGAASRVRSAMGIGVTGELNLQTAVSVLFKSPVIKRRTGDPSSFIYIDNPDTVGTVVVAPVDATDRVAMLGRPLVMDSTPFEEIDWTAQIHQALGDPDESVELTDARTWTVGAWTADKYQTGRVLLAGDAVHVMPPYGGFNQNTGVQDVHNLVWKLAAVLDGWADPALLETYEIERKPVAEYNIAEAVKNFRSIVGNRDTGPRSFRPENFVHPGLDIGFRYDRGAVAGSSASQGTWPVGEFVPTAAVGERAPHLWLDSTRQTSILDLFGRELTVLSRVGSEVADQISGAARNMGVPHRVVAFGAGGDYVEAETSWAELYRVSGDEVILVRPDGHVLARVGAGGSAHGKQALLAYTGQIRD
jgi:putative polyketide hydroxylase